MEQLLAHLTGDYILQNNWMANQKTSKGIIGFLTCLSHVLLYSLPFLFLITSWWQYLLIIGTHFLIDRYRLAVCWIKLVNWNFKSKNFGYSESTPKYISVWLMIIIDNVFHLIINYLILSYI